MSPFYAVPWPVLVAAAGAVVLLCLACYLLGYAERDARREREGR